MKPTNAGYSGKKLVEKLGFASVDQVFVLSPPDWYETYLRSESISLTSDMQHADWIHAYFLSEAEIAAFAEQKQWENAAKGIWVSWPKKSSGVATDLTEQTFRDILLPTGWVDVKVCAVDETWSGLKFLRRKK